jgi:hypothetical protein
MEVFILVKSLFMNSVFVFLMMLVMTVSSVTAFAAVEAVSPSTPLNVAATAESGYVNLTWESVVNATSYNVKRSEESGGPYTTVAGNVYQYQYTDSNIGSMSSYFYVVSAVNSAGESSNSIQVSVTTRVTTLTPLTMSVTVDEEKVQVGQEFTANIWLRNVINIYAEDVIMKYDNSIFDYVGFETVEGYQVVNQPLDQNGTLRFIVASQGVDYGITAPSSAKTFLKLKLRAKAVGVGKVDAVSCMIADIEQQYQLLGKQCRDDVVQVEYNDSGHSDVNKSGEYTLVDLAIDAYYYGQPAYNADQYKYNVNQAGDHFVNNSDLVYIVNQMLSNTNYTPNK